jgi:hypothetical protein
MINTAERYQELERTSCSQAWETAASEILSEKIKLRKLNSRNPLLNLVLVSCGGDIMYNSNFRSILLEHLPLRELPSELSQLEALGYYVDMLRDEQINPKFLPRK